MAAQSPLNGKTILVVDDEAELRKAMIFDLKRLGCKILEAASGAEAIEIARANHIDIILSDIRMPNGTGVELLQHIRAIDPNIPVVLLATGYADITEQDALNMGAYALLEKPLNRKQLRELLERSCQTLKTS